MIVSPHEGGGALRRAKSFSRPRSTSPNPAVLRCFYAIIENTPIYFISKFPIVKREGRHYQKIILIYGSIMKVWYMPLNPLHIQFSFDQPDKSEHSHPNCRPTSPGRPCAGRPVSLEQRDKQKLPTAVSSQVQPLPSPSPSLPPSPPPPPH